jgi:nitroreductase
MKKFLKKILPEPIIAVPRLIKRVYALIVNYIYDFWRYGRFSSSVFRGNTEEKLRALITMHYHSIEKGLSLYDPRPGFGAEAIKDLIAHLNLYLTRHGPAEHLSVPLNALSAYIDHNKRHNIDMTELEEQVDKFKQTYQMALGVLPYGGGVQKLNREDILQAVRGVGADFFLKRYSIRQFSEADVPVELIEEAVRRAQKTPAVCNRQSGRVWLVSGKEKVSQILDIQKGARGFSECVNKIVVVTSDLSNFQSPGERYQSWIDGGLFAMSLIYAFHSLGIGSCCLNWSMGYARDIELKRFLKMSQSETVIMLIAIGMLPEELYVAQSCRKPLAEVMIKV